MATNDNKTPGTIPSALPVSVTQIDEVRKWEDTERTNTRSIIDQQTRRIAPE